MWRLCVQPQVTDLSVQFLQLTDESSVSPPQTVLIKHTNTLRHRPSYHTNRTNRTTVLIPDGTSWDQQRPRQTGLTLVLSSQWSCWAEVKVSELTVRLLSLFWARRWCALTAEVRGHPNPDPHNSFHLNGFVYNKRCLMTRNDVSSSRWQWWEITAITDRNLKQNQTRRWAAETGKVTMNVFFNDQRGCEPALLLRLPLQEVRTIQTI